MLTVHPHAHTVPPVLFSVSGSAFYRSRAGYQQRGDGISLRVAPPTMLQTAEKTSFRQQLQEPVRSLKTFRGLLLKRWGLDKLQSARARSTASVGSGGFQNAEFEFRPTRLSQQSPTCRYYRRAVSNRTAILYPEAMLSTQLANNKTEWFLPRVMPADEKPGRHVRPVSIQDEACLSEIPSSSPCSREFFGDPGFCKLCRLMWHG